MHEPTRQIGINCRAASSEKSSQTLASRAWGDSSGKGSIPATRASQLAVAVSRSSGSRVEEPVAVPTQSRS
jgi:hypothetical protein